MRTSASTFWILACLAMGCSPGPPGQDQPARARLALELERGRYLTNAVADCFDCHSPLLETTPPVPTPHLLGAGDVLNEETGLVAPNITPDLATGVGGWSDAQFERAIRQGIGRDGRRLSTAMPWNYYSILTDADLASVIRYLRSLSPVGSSLPAPPEVAAETLDMPPVEPLSERSLEDPATRGAYLVRLARCVNCHTPLGDHGQSNFTRAFSGGRRFELREFWYAEIAPDPPLAIAGAPDGVDGAIVASANLTPGPSGIPHYSAEVLKKTLRTGKVNGVRPLSSAMPWIAFQHMTDADIEAIFSYLQSLEPIAHRVSNLEPPSYCPVCRRWHGLGSSNAGPAAPPVTAAAPG